MSLLDNAQQDSLTKCYTRDALLPFLEKMRAEYAAYNKPFSLMLIDIDGFKAFNDKHGHIFGDEALRYFASSLRLNLDDEDCVIIRFGGDEFVVVFPGRVAREVHRLAIHIENNIRNRPFLFKSREYKISFSGGIASCPQDGIEAEELIEKADKAMYFSKRNGSGRITQYSGIRIEFVKVFIKVSIILALIVLAFVVARDIFHIDFKTAGDKIRSIRKEIPLMEKPRPAKVYLKSGNTIEGVITDESSNDMSLKFNMPTGEASVVIQKSDIKYVERNYKE